MIDTENERVAEQTTVHRARRLRRARIAAGFASAREFARTCGLNVVTYQHHENGRRPVREDAAKRYAGPLGVTPGDILYGEQLLTSALVPILGVISEKGTVRRMGDATISNETSAPTRRRRAPTIPIPDFSQLEALQIQGDQLYPAYRDGDVVLHRPLHPVMPVPAVLNNVECVVELAKGQRLLRQVLIQADGRVTLIGYGCAPLSDITLVSAAPVEAVLRNTGRRSPPG